MSKRKPYLVRFSVRDCYTIEVQARDEYAAVMKAQDLYERYGEDTARGFIFDFSCGGTDDWDAEELQPNESSCS